MLNSEQKYNSLWLTQPTINLLQAQDSNADCQKKYIPDNGQSKKICALAPS